MLVELRLYLNFLLATPTLTLYAVTQFAACWYAWVDGKMDTSIFHFMYLVAAASMV